MRTSIFLVLLVFFFCYCNQKVQNSPNTNVSDGNVPGFSNYGDTNRGSDTSITLDPHPNLTLIPEGFDGSTLVSSGQSSPYKTIQINGCNFDLVMEGKDTVYLSTADNNFQTPEGYKVGTELKQLPKDIQNNLIKEPGWGYYYKLSSNWTLGFCEGNSCTDKYPKRTSQVKWIFKRR